MRKPAKTISDVEKDETFIFGERDAKKAEPEVEDKRSAPKEFVVERDPTGLYRVKYTAGGEVPVLLKGRFTSINKAQEAINNHNATKQQGGAAGSSTAS